MNRKRTIRSRLGTGPLAAVLSAVLVVPAFARVLDNFDDNTKTAWTDFTFVQPFGIPAEQNGEFRFEIPAAFQQQAKGVFAASTKSSETFTLQEGRTVEFRVDVVQGGAKDSFAVLSWIPVNPQGPSRLQGYSLAKSTTDALIVKGINKYFVADDGPTAELKQENITLVLALTVKGGSVIVNARVLDRAANNQVIWDRTITDTAEADEMEDGTDDPKAPFLGAGNFVLYLYADYDAGAIEDPYVVVYDNAEVFVTETAILDDFNDNTKTDWADFTFVQPFGIPVEENGGFRFEIPAAFQQQVKGVFAASTKTSKTFDLVEGERVEFAVDVVQGGAKDSFAVLSWIPVNPQGPSRLQGYSLAKSTTDALIVKGINKYFVADDGPTAELKQENITLVLSMTVRGGSVIVDARILDKVANNQVIWDRTIVDTPEADEMEDGTDDPKAPFLGAGNFVLYLYADYDAGAIEDPYVVVYDNAAVSAPPPPANVAPIISEVAPAQYANFLAATTAVSFKASDDKALPDANFSISLNGTNYTTANGLVLSATGNSRTATLSDRLVANVNYRAVLRVEDAEGLVATTTLFFDTFAANSLVLEAEDYNFDAGSFIDNPTLVTQGGFDANSYSMQTGYEGVDFHDTRGTPNGTDTVYRQNDPVRMQNSRDHPRAKFEAAGGAQNLVYDYDVVDIESGEWLNFTHTFPAGSYEIYLREALANMARGESVLERVTSDRTLPDQQTEVLGSFLGELTGFQYRNFPLTDGTGQNKIVVQLSGVQTLRLRQVTADGEGARALNYLVFIPTAATGPQRATITSLSPAPDSIVETVQPVIQIEIQNRDTSVKTDTIALTVNGLAVVPVITPLASGASVRYAMDPLPASDVVNQARVSFQDSENATVSSDWSFTVSYKSLNAANRQPGPGKDRGFAVRMVQAPAGTPDLANSLARAEEQLAPNSSIPVYVDTNTVMQLVNMSQDEGAAGFFSAPDYPESLVPGLDEFNGTDDFAVEALAWLELAAGPYRFTVISDDGFKVSSGQALGDKEPVLGFRNGGPADATTGTFDFVVPVAGFYPFRMMWYERGGGAHGEWSAVNLATGERKLINDSTTAAAVKAYLDIVPAPAVKVQSSPVVNSGYADDATATVDTAAKRALVPVSGAIRFYRLVGASALKITSAQVQGANLVMTYE